MLSFGGKNVKNAFFRVKSFFNRIFNQFIACMHVNHVMHQIAKH